MNTCLFDVFASICSIMMRANSEVVEFSNKKEFSEIVVTNLFSIIHLHKYFDRMLHSTSCLHRYWPQNRNQKKKCKRKPVDKNFFYFKLERKKETTWKFKINFTASELFSFYITNAITAYSICLSIASSL